MKVLIAIDSFKESISSIKGSEAISKGIKEVYQDSEIVTLPLADGGEGTVDSLVHATEGQLIKMKVTGPLNEKLEAIYGILGDDKTAVIEVASACGLPLIPEKYRNPLLTTTYGVGELISDALDKGCNNFVIGLGGSATNDAGVGMLRALGFHFMDRHNNEVGFGGKVLEDIHKINTEYVNPRLEGCVFNVACDVNNLLYGTEGAAYIFGPQKGASEDMVKELDTGLKHFAHVVLRDLGQDIHNIKGAGAAGGLGAAFYGFLNANLQSGIELILDHIGMKAHMQGADFVITGEGKMDGQTSMGKAPLGVAQMAKKNNIPVIALAGGVTDETSELNELGVTSYFSITSAPMSLEEAMTWKTTYNNLQSTSKQLFRLIRASR
ncbi:glycerate kinase [Virgibacillus necropolis]|uniref:Glycerate kinase n=1 Tax=Virgibacillus necropolis TaxID=163877 RepID=A0A221MGC6_9BACI|nr:glycerate kinase [Virgibacillus necropolis]ASN06684.1 glycerate kinase [Virgibacillus necropolis]